MEKSGAKFQKTPLRYIGDIVDSVRIIFIHNLPYFCSAQKYNF